MWPVAVADRRLGVTAKSATNVSLDTAPKIREFTPSYDIPKRAMGAFNHYSRYTEADWFGMHAGTYALVSEILDPFMRRMRDGLILTRVNGKPTPGRP